MQSWSAFLSFVASAIPMLMTIFISFGINMQFLYAYFSFSPSLTTSLYRFCSLDIIPFSLLLRKLLCFHQSNIVLYASLTHALLPLQVCPLHYTVSLSKYESVVLPR